MKDILEPRSDVVVSAGTSQRKSLTFQALPVLSDTSTVLVICPTLALMDDQVFECVVFDQKLFGEQSQVGR